MPARPSGTVTFLFTDIEGSTGLWERQPEAMRTALARHDALLRAAIERHHGYVFKTVGDAFCAAFPTARDALHATLEAQRALRDEPWEARIGAIRVRMGLHTGEAVERDGDYFGPTVNRTARLQATAAGGQIVLSLATQSMLADALPPDVTLLDLGAHRLKDLIQPERIFQVVAPDLPSEFPPLRSLDRRPHNLPAQPNALIGREAEIEAARALLVDEAARLVTLTGPGGTGKTRLALQVAAESLDAFADGVYFVALAAITDPALVPSTIAETLGLRETGGRSAVEVLEDYVRDRSLLLVLDNVEQVVDTAPVLAELLAAGPGLRLLVTSRVRLQLRGEHEIEVPPLALPDERRLPPLDALALVPSVALFLQRAREVRRDFALTPENAAAVAEICRRLDGLPLALELAAARIKLLTPQAMLARLGNRLTLLTGGARDLPARQQTLRGAIAWSYDLLDAAERSLFRRLAVFVDGCTYEAAEAVCNPEQDLELDVLDGLGSLVDKSLLRQSEQPDGEPRFQMLETIREFGLEQLAAGSDAQAVERAHATYYRALAKTGQAHLRRPEQAEWLRRLQIEHGNLRAALERALRRRDLGTALGLSSTLWSFWDQKDYVTEGRRWLAAVLDAAGPEAAAALEDGALNRGWALNGAGLLARRQGDYDQAIRAFEQAQAALERHGDPRLLASVQVNLATLFIDLGRYEAAASIFHDTLRSLGGSDSVAGRAAIHNNLGSLYFRLGRLGEAAESYTAALELYRACEDRNRLALAQMNLGLVVRDQGRLDEAAELLEASLAVFRELDNRVFLASALNNLGELAHQQGELGRAAALFGESLALRRELGEKPYLALTLQNLGDLALDRGDLAGAAAHFRESLELAGALDSRGGVRRGLEGMAGVALAAGEPRVATRLLTAAEQIDAGLAEVRPRPQQVRYERLAGAIRAALGEAELRAARAAVADEPLAELIAAAVRYCPGPVAVSQSSA